MKLCLGIENCTEELMNEVTNGADVAVRYHWGRQLKPCEQIEAKPRKAPSRESSGMR